MDEVSASGEESVSYGKVDRYINRQLLSFYLTYPQLVKQNEDNLEGLKPIYGDVIIDQPRKENLLDMMQMMSCLTGCLRKICW